MGKMIFKYVAMMSAMLMTVIGCSDFDGGDSRVEWFPIGAEWRYYFYQQYEMFFTVEKDTLVEGINCRVIAGKDGRHVVYEKKGRVYYYFMNKFRKIYDFNVKAGDVVEFEFKTSDAVDAGEAIDRLNTTIVLPCRIESITTKVVDGIPLREISARYTYTGSDPRLQFEYLHVYHEKVGNEYIGNSGPGILSDGFFPVCPEKVIPPATIKVAFSHYIDHEIEYFPYWWSARLKLIPQPDPNYLATEDPEMKALVLKHNVEFIQMAPGATFPENLLLYRLKGIDGRKNAIKDFLATGKFEDDVYYFPGVWLSSLQIENMTKTSMNSHPY